MSENKPVNDPVAEIDAVIAYIAAHTPPVTRAQAERFLRLNPNLFEETEDGTNE
jgi:hypothetical protein